MSAMKPSKELVEMAAQDDFKPGLVRNELAHALNQRLTASDLDWLVAFIISSVEHKRAEFGERVARECAKIVRESSDNYTHVSVADEIVARFGLAEEDQEGGSEG